MLTTATYYTKDGKAFNIREATRKDAEAILEFAHLLFESTDQVLTTAGEFTNTVELERDWIVRCNEHPGALVLVAEVNHIIVGLLDFVTQPKQKSQHWGEFGVSIHPNFRNKGIGERLTQHFLQWAIENPMVEKVILRVFETNQPAITLYKKLGFTEEARHIKAIKQPTGEYIDLLQMYIFVK